MGTTHKTDPAKTAAQVDSPPVAVSDIQACLDSALYWVGALPRYANRMQLTADVFAIVAAVLGVVTGLAIWGTVAESDTYQAQFLVTGVALLAGICAVVPRILNFGEMAGSARGLIARYARSAGELRRYWEHQEWLDRPQAETVIETFEAIKEAKDQLRYLPTRPSEPTKRVNGIAEWREAELSGAWQSRKAATT